MKKGKTFQKKPTLYKLFLSLCLKTFTKNSVQHVSEQTSASTSGCPLVYNLKFQTNFIKKCSFSSFFDWKFTLFSSHTMNFDIKFQPYETAIFRFSISLLLLISLPKSIMVRHSSNLHQSYYLLPTHRDPIRLTYISGEPNQEGLINII